MIIEGAEWALCTPAWVYRYNACGETIRQAVLDIGHEHLMANGCPVLWTDALGGQRDRLQMEAGEKLAMEQEDPDTTDPF